VSPPMYCERVGKGQRRRVFSRPHALLAKGTGSLRMSDAVPLVCGELW
jgi:hypothetical protein